VLIEQLLRGADGPSGTRAEHAISLAVVLAGETPACILRAETSKHWLAGMHGDHEGPGAVGVGRLDRHVAKAAEADLGDAAPGFDPANGTQAAINMAFAKRPACYIDAQGLGVIDEGFDARPIRLARFDDLFSFVHLLPPSSENQTGL